jgi:hypothetical protein
MNDEETMKMRGVILHACHVAIAGRKIYLSYYNKGWEIIKKEAS